MIARGDADLMVAGGAESAVNVLGLSGFARMKAITAEFNDAPEKASRPWDKNRSGFVMGEGSGALVLEELEHAKKRGAKIYAEVVGYGMSGDAYHITAPSGDGAYRAMKMAVEHAKENGVELSDIGYINAHGTSTPAGDVGEAMAVKRLFGDEGVKHVSMSSTKSAIGHLLGAAGAVEAVYTIKAILEQTCPPTLNLEDPADELVDFDLVPLKAKKREIKAAMSNSFGFGGTNSSLVFKKYNG
jgi:3-oxoacyl-[acyl-carrier-protein] synthase II